MKDWKGNIQSTLTTIGARNYATSEREQSDYYATEPKAVRLLLETEHFPKNTVIWECACGGGHLSEEMKRLGYTVFSSDYYDRGYKDTKIIDFIGMFNTEPTDMNIITNPPYRLANDFITRAIQILAHDNKLALLLPTRYLEGKARKEIFRQHPPKTIHVSSGRLVCALGGNFGKMSGSAQSYSWFVWQKGHKAETIVKWFN